ncbi:MAG: putative toxin-antitoxin system toxin component, PIN family [Nanoarchaeota archaeon]
MIKVVVDTNVFISGIFWEGNFCSQIIDLWGLGEITIVSSLDIIEELVKTLRDFKVEMPDDMIEEWQNKIIENAVIVEPKERLDVVKGDSKDNKFFEAALAGKAEYIVSQDKKHILSIKEYKGIKTISPEDFLELIK